jgi:hypothetical protein
MHQRERIVREEEILYVSWCQRPTGDDDRWEVVGVIRFERSEQLREAMWQRCWIVVQVETSVDDQERPGTSERRGTGTEDTSVLFSRSIHTSNN